MVSFYLIHLFTRDSYVVKMVQILFAQLLNGPIRVPPQVLRPLECQGSRLYHLKVPMQNYLQFAKKRALQNFKGTYIIFAQIALIYIALISQEISTFFVADVTELICSKNCRRGCLAYIFFGSIFIVSHIATTGLSSEN